MKRYKAYLQNDPNAERFYIDGRSQQDVIITAPDDETAEREFMNYLRANSWMNDADTERWLNTVILTVEEVRA